MKYKSLLISASLILAWGSVMAQNAGNSCCEKSGKELTLEDIFSKKEYVAKGINSLKWMDDNKSYSAIEKNDSLGGDEIVSYDIRTGERRVLVSVPMLTPEGAGKSLPVDDYSWSEDHSRLLIFTNTARVWRYNTRGDYWVLDLKSGKLTQIGKGMEPSRLMFAKFSPEADRVAYVYFNNIYVEDLATSTITRLTEDGSDVIINGTFDWVYEEELKLTDGFRWSPDGKHIAFWRFDTEGTGVFHMVNNIDSVYAKLISFPYPKIGTTNAAGKIGVIDTETAQTRWFDIPGDEREHYLARMEFIPESDDVMIQQLNRLQNTNRVFVGNVETMEINNIMTDTDEAFLDIHDNIVWLDHQKYFTWTSEKDGWRHLYKVSRDGKQETLITKGEFDVISIQCIDEKGGYVYYIASPDSAVESYLYRSRLNGKGQAERITPAAMPGTHSYNINPNAKYAVHRYSNSSTPDIYELVKLPSHKTIRVLEDNAELAEKLARLDIGRKEYFKVQIPGVELDGWMIKPVNFDPSRKYPVIFYVYGEPASSTVQDVWSMRDLWNYYMAEQGYIVMSVDPRGTNNPKGREWRKSIYGKIGIVPPADHAAAVLEIEKQMPFVDASRIGIWGWSGGGASTAHAMFKYPEIYKVGIGVAGLYSHMVYDTIYQERYMGLPSTNAQGLHDGSAINFAANLQGDLFIIHGSADDNVHFQACEMLVDELVKHNKQFEMFVYPMRSHSINERENTSYHLYQMMRNYWLEHLEPGAK